MLIFSKKKKIIIFRKKKIFLKIKLNFIKKLFVVKINIISKINKYEETLKIQNFLII